MTDVTGLPSAPVVKRRSVWGWMLFDWAAQPFFTVVTTFIFGPYFISRMASDPATGQAAWGYGIAAGGLLIALFSPILGSIADQTGPRKPWIAFFAILKILALCSLWFAAPGSSVVAVVVAFTLASVAAEFSIVFNDSMLLRLVPKAQIGRVSNLAWGLGYLGGMIVLIFIIAFLAASPETGKTLIGLDPLFGLDPVQGEDARASGPISALWYAVFILPMFLFTPDAGGRRALKGAVRDGLAELRSTIGEVRQRAGIFRFLVARMIYQDGVNALLALGGGFAAAMFGWSITEIGVYGIMLNVVAIFSCLYASRLDTQLGSKLVVLIAILLADRHGRHRLHRTGLHPVRRTAAWGCGHRRIVRNGCRKSLHHVRLADRHSLRPGTGVVPRLHGAECHRRRGWTLLRYLCTGRARHQLPRPFPGRHRHGIERIGAPGHGNHHPVLRGRPDHSLDHALSSRPGRPEN
jgi:UMF1 family MFS transporter